MAERGKADIVQVLENAKLHPDDLYPLVQEIHFHPDFGGGDYRLVELDAEADKFLSSGSSLVLRGVPGESAMLCTDDSTFELKDAEISNSLLIMETLTFPEEAAKEKEPQKAGSLEVLSGADRLIVEQKLIRNVAHSYVEMRRVKPNLGRVVQMLEPTCYRGKEEEYQIDAAQLMTMENMLSEISASINEIKTYLEMLKIIEIDGFLRIVDYEYLLRVLNFILETVEEFSWSRRSIEKSTVIAQLCTLEPNFILEKVFEWFFTPAPASTSNNDDDALSIAEQLYTFNGDAICHLFGAVILKRGRKFSVRDFVKSWQESVPKGLKVNLKQLNDVACIDETSTLATICYFPEHSLPTSTQDRLSVLFDLKPKWKHDEIMPFVRNVATSEQNASALLTKFCRITSPEGVKTYSAKYK